MSHKKKQDAGNFIATLRIDDNADINLLIRIVNRLFRRRISRMKGKERIVVEVMVEDVNVLNAGGKG